jgi:hypothetical protein
MATRIGNVKEFEFKTIGQNHSQGVSLLFSFYVQCDLLDAQMV